MSHSYLTSPTSNSVEVAEVESSTPKIVPKLPMEFLAGVYNSEAEICVAGFAMKRYLPTFKTIVYTDCKWIPSPWIPYFTHESSFACAYQRCANCRDKYYQ